MHSEKKRKRHRKRKSKSSRMTGTFLMKAVLLIGIMGSSVSTAFANQDISSILTSWFTKQKDTAIEEIREAINSERDIQLVRLHDQLQLEIQSAAEYMKAYKDDEKVKRVNELRSYADQLIINLEMNCSEDEAVIRSEFEAIFQNAVAQMEQVGQPGPLTDQLTAEEKEINSNLIKKPEKKSDSEPVEEPEQKPMPDADMEAEIEGEE